jgi:hypothetical protein
MFGFVSKNCFNCAEIPRERERKRENHFNKETRETRSLQRNESEKEHDGTAFIASARCFLEASCSMNHNNE